MPKENGRDFYLIVEGDIETEKFLEAVKTQLFPAMKKGFGNYITKHLIPRIRKRLGNAEKAHQQTTGVSDIPGMKGLITKAGGYGIKKNNEAYANWKSSRTNLPLVGDEPARTLIATGYLLDSVSLINLKDFGDNWFAKVGSLNFTRPVAKMFSGKKEGGPAEFEGQITNLKLWDLLEEKGYKVWAVEFEDVRRDAEVLALRLIKQTIEELANKFAKQKGKNV
jgi:hypothetical protein